MPRGPYTRALERVAGAPAEPMYCDSLRTKYGKLRQHAGRTSNERVASDFGHGRTGKVFTSHEKGCNAEG